MSDWYYSTDGQQPSGPLGTVELRRMLDSGQLPARTLLWREGLPGWCRRNALADELGQPAPAPQVPSLPPELPPATRTDATNSAIPALRQPVEKTRTGVILLVVGLCLLVVFVVIFAILAAIAIPAYQAYSERARAAATLRALSPLQQQVLQFQLDNGHCPDQHSPGFMPAASYADPAAHLAEVAVVTAANGNCGLAASLDGLHRDQDKRQAWLWLELDAEAGHWFCRSSLTDSQLPVRCQQQ